MIRSLTLVLLLTLTVGDPAGLGAQEPPTPPAVARGELRSLGGGALESPAVFVKAVDASGTIVWEAAIPVGDGGRFEVTADRLAALPDAGHAFVTAEARWHLEARAELTFRRGGGDGDRAGGWSLTPDRFLLLLEPTRPDLTLLFLVPALVGSLLPVLFWRAASGAAPPADLPAGRPTSPWLRPFQAVFGAARFSLHAVWRHLPGLYALLATVIWALVVGRMLQVYLSSGVHYMPLFWPDLVISTGAPIFAFVGSLVYVAFSLYLRYDPGDLSSVLVFQHGERLQRAFPQVPNARPTLAEPEPRPAPSVDYLQLLREELDHKLLEKARPLAYVELTVEPGFDRQAFVRTVTELAGCDSHHEIGAFWDTWEPIPESLTRIACEHAVRLHGRGRHPRVVLCALRTLLLAHVKNPQRPDPEDPA